MTRHCLDHVAVENRLAVGAHQPQDTGAVCTSRCSCEYIPFARRLRHLAPGSSSWVIVPDLH